jgi:class 3 adenylate cyclase
MSYFYTYLQPTPSWPTASAVEMATLKWVDWFNNHRLFGPIGHITPAEAEANYYAAKENLDMVASLKPNRLWKIRDASASKGFRSGVRMSDVSTSFAASERIQRAWITRYGILLAALSLVGTTYQNMATFEPSASLQYLNWAAVLSINLGVAFWWTTSRWFPTMLIGDLIVTLPIIVWMLMIREVIITQSTITNWAAVATILANHTLGAAFASLFFPANWRLYAVWVTGHAAVFFVSLNSTAAEQIEVAFAWGVYVPVSLVLLYNLWAIDQKARANFKLSLELAQEKAKSEEMLFSILPEEVATRLRAGQAVADAFSDATVVFVDLVGSSELARNLSPRHFLQTLNEVFSVADRAAIRFGVEKVKTIGDGYLAVSGARCGGDAICAINFAQSVIEGVQALAVKHDLALTVRVGIHTGPVVGGVIGETRAIYDYWGDTVNVAARIEAAADAGGISVTKQTYYATRSKVEYLPPRTIVLKGIGETQVYDVC